MITPAPVYLTAFLAGILCMVASFTVPIRAHKFMCVLIGVACLLFGAEYWIFLAEGTPVEVRQNWVRGSLVFMFSMISICAGGIIILHGRERKK